MVAACLSLRWGRRWGKSVGKSGGSAGVADAEPQQDAVEQCVPVGPRLGRHVRCQVGVLLQPEAGDGDDPAEEQREADLQVNRVEARCAVDELLAQASTDMV